jgi:hypothetical protein
MLAACGTAVSRSHSGTLYPTKEVVRQSVVYEHTVDPRGGGRLTETTQRVSATRYYLFARDGYTCEVDYMLYVAVLPGDRVACHWVPQTRDVESLP